MGRVSKKRTQTVIFDGYLRREVAKGVFESYSTRLTLKFEKSIDWIGDICGDCQGPGPSLPSAKNVETKFNGFIADVNGNMEIQTVAECEGPCMRAFEYQFRLPAFRDNVYTRDNASGGQFMAYYDEWFGKRR